MKQAILSYLETKGFSNISTIEGLSEPFITAEKKQKKIGFMLMSEDDGIATEDNIRKAHGANTAYQCNGTALIVPYGIADEAIELSAKLNIMVWDKDYLDKEGIKLPEKPKPEETEPDINAEPSVRETFLAQQNRQASDNNVPETEIKPKKKNNKNLINYILLAATVAMLILLVTLVQTRFTKAQEKALAGEYTEAVKLYSSIKWYRGSKNKAEELVEKAEEETAAKAYMYGITTYHMCGLISDKWHESEENNADAKQEINKLIETWDKNGALSFATQLGNGVSDRLRTLEKLGLDEEQSYELTKKIYELSTELYAYGYNLTASSISTYNAHITVKYNELQELYTQLKFILPEIDSAYQAEQSRINTIVPN